MQIVFLMMTISLLTVYLIYLNNELWLVRYAKIMCFVLPVLYCFIDLPSEFDLYRHYEIFESLNNYSFIDVASNQTVWEAQQKEGPLYIIGMWTISGILPKIFLPYIVGVIVYISGVYILSDCKKRYKISNFAYGVSIIVLFLLTDFVSVTGIRNIFCSTVFVWLLYRELIIKKNVILVYIGYIVLCTIHSITLVYVLVRLMIFIYTPKRLGLFILGIVLIIYELPELVINYGMQILQLPVLGNIIWLYYKYSNNFAGNSILVGKQITYLMLYLYGVILVLKLDKKINENENIKRILEFTLIFLIFTLGLYHLYDMFSRSSFLVIPLICLLEEVYLDSFIDTEKITVFSGNVCSLLLYILGGVVFLMLALYRFIYQYLPLTDYFIL